MDIDDILREADPDFDTTPQATRDLHALTRAWVAERSSPEVLEYVILCARSAQMIRWVTGKLMNI